MGLSSRKHLNAGLEQLAIDWCESSKCTPGRAAGKRLHSASSEGLRVGDLNPHGSEIAI
jgi:hypothetical protein